MMWEAMSVEGGVDSSSVYKRWRRRVYCARIVSRSWEVLGC